LRDATERPATVSDGTNRVIGSHPERVAAEIERILDGDRPAQRCPSLWDGRAAERVVEVLAGWSGVTTMPL
jgi:UDP-N-acetylglucosamine 2-epimerase (non-hydrolysing)